MAVFRRKQDDEHRDAGAVQSVATGVPRANALEESELARRLRGLDWPSAPDDVRERCLTEIMRRVEERSPAPDGSGA
jgi:hypothetical protein